MDKFDPDKHRVVAVPFRDDDPERGQHFHVDLDALVAAAREDSQELIPVDNTQVAFLSKQVAKVREDLAEVASRPHLTPTGSCCCDRRRWSLPRTARR